MKQLFFLVTISISLSYSALSQKEIIYTFDSIVSDSLQFGIDKYSRKLNKKAHELRLAVLIDESNGVYDLFLQDYTHLTKSGLLTILNNSNRKLRINSNLIPVLFPCDILSDDIKEDNIQYLPYSGYYLRVISEKGSQKVIEVRDLF